MDKYQSLNDELRVSYLFFLIFLLRSNVIFMFFSFFPEWYCRGGDSG